MSNYSNDRQETSKMHLLSEVVVIGSMAVYFYKRVASLEKDLEELKNRVDKQHTLLEQLMGSRPTETLQRQQPQPCVGDSCDLSSYRRDRPKVVISKLSKEIQFGESPSVESCSRSVATFSKPDQSPNPVLKSVSPAPSLHDTNDELKKILDNIEIDG